MCDLCTKKFEKSVRKPAHGHERVLAVRIWPGFELLAGKSLQQIACLFFFSFLDFLNFPPGTGSKNKVFWAKNLSIIGLQSTFSEALRQVKRQHMKGKFWNWLSYNNSAQHNMSQKSLHPSAKYEF